MNSSEIEAEILATIAKSESADTKAMLLIIHAVLREVQAISGKMDALLKDEKAIKKIVLNGHDEVHHDDHEFIATLRQSDCREMCHKMRDHLEASEAQAAADAASARKIRDGVIEKVLWAVLVLVAGASGWMR